MARHIFRSVQYPQKYAYAHDSENWRGEQRAARHAVFFQTYGDELCQHSGDCNLSRELLGDYLASLAKALLAEFPKLEPDTSRDSLMAAIQFDVAGHKPHQEAIAFCAGVVFKPREGSESYESKPRYYSVQLRKMSSAPEKAYDKRYRMVESWNTGSPEAVYTMLHPEYAADALQQYAIVEAVREWFHSHPTKHYVQSAAEMLEWPEYTGKHRDRGHVLRHAFNACCALCEAWRLRCNAESELSNVRCVLDAETSNANTNNNSNTENVA